MYARSLALLPDCHSSSSIFAPRYCAPGEWVALAPSSGQQEVCHIGYEPPDQQTPNRPAAHTFEPLLTRSLAVVSS